MKTSEQDKYLLDELLSTLIERAREVCAAWHDASRLDGPERLERALKELEDIVGWERR